MPHAPGLNARKAGMPRVCPEPSHPASSTVLVKKSGWMAYDPDFPVSTNCIPLESRAADLHGNQAEVLIAYSVSL